MTDLPLRCRCGRVRGVALRMKPHSAGHVVCYCEDCQAFARFLGTPGIMDEHGGSQIFQIPPARFRITGGIEAVACIRLAPKGLIRWYAACCRTPIGNTVGAKVPFIGLLEAFRSRDPGTPSLGDVLQPPVRMFGRSGIGGAPPGTYETGPRTLMAWYAMKMLGWLVTGQGKPWALFDAKTGAARVPPQVLTAGERDALRSAQA